MCVGERLKRASSCGHANTGVLLPLCMRVCMFAYAISFSRRQLAANGLLSHDRLTEPDT